MIWLTAQNSNFAGRIDPKTGEIKLLTSPGDIVRNAPVTASGDFLLANSLKNEVTLVKIEKATH
jgi:streptogramin lyase